MRVLGITALGHDASVALIEDNNILHASHSERFSRIKNDKYLDDEQIEYMVSRFGLPDIISFYENPVFKKLRQLRAGQYKQVFDIHDFAPNYLYEFDDFHNIPIVYQDHHKSHAATGYYTSDFDECVVVVIDAIGEFTTLSIWRGEDNKLSKIRSLNYPHSLGLFYSAFTQRLGLKPNEEEYIMMGMAAYGEPKYYKQIAQDFIRYPKFLYNFHKGLPDTYLSDADDYDIAASVQKITEDYIYKVLEEASQYSKNLVYCGGVVLNCLANRNIHNYFDKVWIPNNPGDSGSAVGAATLITQQKIKTKTPFLGYEIEGTYPVKEACDLLVKGNIIGVANSKAEFGPRAFGNRSLLADPRGPHIKDRVNEIKKRQKFRPFSPVILEEHAKEYFEMYIDKSPYMQYVFKCKYPDKFPAIIHKDKTSRVQTVGKDGSGIRELLEEFYKRTGCPMLLNTSLNIKGEPLVNDIDDAKKFEKKHNIPVLV